MRNIKISNKVRADVLRMVSPAQVRLWIDGVYPHSPHHSADFLAVDQKVIIFSYDPRNGTVSPGGVICVQLHQSFA